jgi:hypothetical protein
MAYVNSVGAYTRLKVQTAGTYQNNYIIESKTTSSNSSNTSSYTYKYVPIVEFDPYWLNNFKELEIF